MFIAVLNDFRLRSEAVNKLAWYLAHEEDSLRKLPMFSTLRVDTLSDIFLCDHQKSLVDEDLSRSIFQVTYSSVMLPRTKMTNS